MFEGAARLIWVKGQLRSLFPLSLPHCTSLTPCHKITISSPPPTLHLSHSVPQDLHLLVPHYGALLCLVRVEKGRRLSILVCSIFAVRP